MEPVSVLALVGTSLGVARSGALALEAIYEHYQNLRNAPENIRFLRDDVSSVEGLLAQIKANVVEGGFMTLFPQLHECIQRSLVVCLSCLRSVAEFAQKHKLKADTVSVLGRLRYTWDKAEIDAYRAELRTRIDYITKIHTMAFVSGATMQNQQQLLQILKGPGALSRLEDQPPPYATPADDASDDSDKELAAAPEARRVRTTLTKKASGTGTLRFSSKKWSRTLIEASAEGNVKLMRECLKKRADPNHQSRDKVPKHGGRGALHAAAEAGNLDAVELLLGTGANIELPLVDSRRTALHLAAVGGFSPVVENLVRYGANLNARDQLGQTALLAANSEDVKILLVEAGTDLSVRGLDAQGALHYAAAFGHADTVRCMLKRGASVDIRDKFERTPLWHACAGRGIAEQKHEPVVDMLLAAGAAPGTASTTDKRTTPFCMAVQHSRLRLVKKLLDRDNAVSLVKARHLHQTAGETGSVDVLKVLLRHFPNVDVKNDAGATPLHLAVRAGHDACVEALVHNDPPASLDARLPPDSYTPLHLAFKNPDISVAITLLAAHRQRGVPFENLQSSRKLLPIHRALTANHVEAWAVADGPIRTLPDGAPPLLPHAVWNSGPEVVRALIRHGADTTLRSARGESLVDLLCSPEMEARWSSDREFRERMAVLHVLVESGVKVSRRSRASVRGWKDQALARRVQAQLPGWPVEQVGVVVAVIVGVLCYWGAYYYMTVIKPSKEVITDLAGGEVTTGIPSLEHV